jgi:N-acetylglucosamine-6-phosphate deacetylase
MLTAYTANRALLADGVLSDAAVVLVEDGRILQVAAADALEVPSGARTVALGDTLLAPALVDVHCHGSAGHDVMEASKDGERAMAAFLASHGVGRFLATTVTASVDSTLQALERIAHWIERDDHREGARPVGIHLEGPFISHGKRGVQPDEHIQSPSVEMFDRFHQASRGHILLMTIAPEIPGAVELIRHAASQGVKISLGHSEATAAQGRAGIAAGAVSATHCFNAMRGFDHREAGLAGLVLDECALYAELICDGHHVSDEAIRLFTAAKPADRRILITDAISATGQGDGKFRLGDLQVTVEGARAMLDGKLAGSVLTLDRGVGKFLAATGCGLAEAAVAAGANPARMLGLSAKLEPGADADFVALDASGRLVATVLAGCRIG